MNQVGKTLTRHHKKILFSVFLITGFLFYYAFFSDSKIRVDFSLEQMFPENDPEKEIYDNFRSKFPREDNSVLMIYAPPTNPLNMENLIAVDYVANGIKKIKTNSNCINLNSFPCNGDDEIDYKNIGMIGNSKKIAYFYDYAEEEFYSDEGEGSWIDRKVFFRVFHFSEDSVLHDISFSNLKLKGKPLDLDLSKNLQIESSNNFYNDYILYLDEDYAENFICFESIEEQGELRSKEKIDINHTPFYMVDGCAGEYSSNQKIYSLANIKDGQDNFLVDIDPFLTSSNNSLYFNDCGFDGLCPNDEGYDSRDQGEFNNRFDCEPFDCGEDGICPDSFYKQYQMQIPEENNYTSEDDGEGDFPYSDWNDLDDGVLYDELEFVDLNANNEFDCEYFDKSRFNIERFVKNHPLYNNLLLSSTNNVGGLFFTLDSRIKDHESRSLFFNQLDEIIRENKESYNWFWADGGIPVLRTRYIELVHSERNTFIPLAFLVVVVILFIVFRNIKSIVLPILTMSITLIWVSALMAFLGMTINIVSYLTYNLLLIIGCSNAIHIQMKYHEGLYLKSSKIDSLRSVIDKIGGALFLTSFTTAIGFFSLCMTNIKLTKDFGLILGIGVFLMFVMMIVVLPLLLLLTKTPKRSMSIRLMKGGSHKFISWIYKIVLKRSKTIAAISFIMFAIVTVGLFKIDYNVSILDDLRPSNQIYKDIKAVEGNMGGVFPIEIMIEYDSPIIPLGKDGSLGKEPLNPLVLKESRGHLSDIARFKKAVSNIEKISGVVTFTDYLSLYLNRMSGVLQEENNTSSDIFDFTFRDEDLPENDAEFVNIFNPDSKFIKSALATISNDFKTIRVSGRMENVKADQAKKIKDEIIKISEEVFESKTKSVDITGSTFLALKTADHLVFNLTNSFALAFVIIFISMVVLFRSFRLSLISVLPNIIPLMLAAAVMGFQDIKLRPTTAMTFAIALGIAVDDTIHFLARFRQEYSRTNNINKSIKNTLFTTGKAIISTTMVLSLGFAVLYFSELMPNHEFGILATIILIAALFGSILLLPALLVLFKPKINIGKE